MERNRGRMRMVHLGYDHIENLVSNGYTVKGLSHNVYFLTLPSDPSGSMTESFASMKFAIVLSRYICLHGLRMKDVAITTTDEFTKSLVIQNMKTTPQLQAKGRQAQVTTIGQLKNETDVVILYLGNRTACLDNFSLFSLIPKVSKSLFIVGPERNLCGTEETKGVLELLKKKGLYGPSLWIKCTQHRVLQQITQVAEFPKSGGCDSLCMFTLGCGHFCKRKCHPYSPRAHGERDKICVELCGRMCERGHPCGAICHQNQNQNQNQDQNQSPSDFGSNLDTTCPPCKVMEKKRFKCGHCVIFSCYDAEKYINATCLYLQCQPKPKILSCGHKFEEKFVWYQNSELNVNVNVNVKDNNIKDFPCSAKVMKKLPCGHDLLLGCQQLVEGIECKWWVTVPRCPHLVPEKVQCFRKDEPIPPRRCIYDCWEKMTCSPSHVCLETCAGVSLTQEEHKAVHPCKNSCERACTNGHKCNPKHLCHEPCEPCEVSMYKVILKKHLDLRQKKDKNPDPTLDSQNNDQDFLVKYPCCVEKELVLKIKEYFKELDDDAPEICSKLCRRRRHPCSVLHPPKDECPPCKEKVKFYFASCKHGVDIACQDDVARICLASCERKRKCDHPCPIICGQHENGICPPCQETVADSKPCGHLWTHLCSQKLSIGHKCMEIVDAKPLANCGHSDILMQCHLTRKIAIGEASMYCEAVCNFFFDPSMGGCGHYCQDICQNCTFSLFHSECSEQVNRTLICGHEFREPCYMSSICTKKCETSCKHRRCDLICALPCKPCKEPCPYGCKHGKCSKRCDEPCNKMPCLEKCTKTIIKCGHPCAGFCGEPCPPLCPICDKHVLIGYNYMCKETINQNDRFILLVDCGHTFESEFLDQLMAIEIVTGQITWKRCPLCRTIIRNNLRYSSTLRKIHKDIESVKEIIYGREGDIQLKLQHTKKLLNSNHEKIDEPSYLTSMRKALLKEIPTNLPNQNRNRRMEMEFTKFTEQKEQVSSISITPMNLAKASCLNFLAEFYSRCLRLWKEMQEISPTFYTDPYDILEYWETFVAHVMEILSCRHYPLRRRDMIVVIQEWDRIFSLSKLLRKRSGSQPLGVQRLLIQPRGQKLYEKALNFIARYVPFEESVRENFEKAFAELEIALDSKLFVTEGERMGIMKAFDYSVGRWFKCPNGHIYVVTECGGVTEEGRCNECGAKIGGLHHRILYSNELASEMDGAKGPLYPTVFGPV